MNTKFKAINKHIMLGTILSLAISTQAAQTDLSTIPLSTYFAPSSVDVKPNILFVLDDSGSMAWDAMPDQAAWYISYNVNYRPRNYDESIDAGMPPYMRYNNAFNGVAYTPAIRYQPPAYFDANGTANTTTYPPMSGISAANGGDGSASVTAPNWKAVPIDGYGVQSNSTENLTNNAYSYIVIPGEYCDAPNLRTCTTASAPSTTYPYPAKMRWCSSEALSTCRATWDSGNNYPRMPAPRISRITISGSVSTSVSGITVNSAQIMSGASASSTSSSTVATRIVTAINACTNGRTGNCTASGYAATSTDSVVTIYAPEITTATPAVNVASNKMTFTASSFARAKIPLAYWLSGTYTTQSATDIPGENLRHTITASTTSYPYPGSAAKAPARTDCAGTTCTYAEEMTNYANWYAYYRTRMQMMKTATSLAFSRIDPAADLANNVSRFRLGYMTLNNNTGADFLNLDEFKTSHKNDWYTKLLSAIPNSGTPLRATLAKAGRLFSGKYNTSTLNGVSVSDPMQYSCQQNFTILSTDGFWNGSAGAKLDGTTAVGNQDAAMPPPYNDGGIATLESRTSTLQSRTETQTAEKGLLQSQTSQLQTQTSQLQKRTYSQLQTRTRFDSSSAWSGWSDVAAGNTCTWKTTGYPRRECRYDGKNWSDWADEAASCTPKNPGTSTSNGAIWAPGVGCQYTVWTDWSPTQTCSTTAQDTSGEWTNPIARQCQTVISTAYADTATCTPTTTPNTDGKTTQCQYRWETAAPTQTCAPAYAANNFTNPAVYRKCTPSSTQWSNASSCSVSEWNLSGTRTGCQYSAWSSWSTATTCAAAEQSVGPDYTVGTARECRVASTSGGYDDTLADVAAYYYNTDLRNPANQNTAAGTGTCTGPVISPATTPNDLCANNQTPNGRDVAAWQHMTTFTLGLGAQGKMLFSPTYWNDNSGDFYSVSTGAAADPANGICSWIGSGQKCVWPQPSNDNPANIDDLWHAAVNGRGSYFSATDPTSLASGLSSTLAAIVETPRPGTSAAAASSNPNISAGDNYVFSSYYKSFDWYGNLYRQRFDTISKKLTSDIDWSAMAMLDCSTTVWKANKAYVAGNVYRNGTSCLLVATDYVSGATFGTTDTEKTAIISHVPSECAANSWAADTDYATDSIYSKDGVCYYVIKSYKSAATFGTSDAQNTNAAYVAGASSSRTIYTKGSSGLTAFTWENLSETQKTYFTSPAIVYSAGPPPSGLSQFCSPAGGTCLSTTAQTQITVATNGAAGESLVNYLRGDRSNEGSFFRERKHVLGDIVSSEARYVKTPLFNYKEDKDPGYSDFKLTKENRRGATYVASNDGMLHSIDAETGKELWAYIPDLVLPNIYKLADTNYKQNHQYFVDGTPETGDICPTAPTTSCTNSTWKTIIVGGLNRGGKGYYALDITDPLNPVLLWEYTDSKMGYSYGNPRITKLKTGQWVVLLTSGYNNTADGLGRLYVLDAYTGTLIRTISTSAGSPATPSGLARISAYTLTADTDNTTSAVYGGDMLGNLWRFDINNDIGAAGYDAQLLVSFKDTENNPQPITAKPVVSKINNFPVIFVGTGSYLGTSDVSSTQSQTMYAVKDNGGSSTYATPRLSGSKFIKQTLTAGTCDVTSSFCTPGATVRKETSVSGVNWSTDNGWYVDFLTGGERASTDPALALGTLAFTTITPNNASVQPCGDPEKDSSASFLYAMDYLNGGPIPGTGGVVGISLGNVIATRPVVIRAPDGTVFTMIRTSGSSSTGNSGDPVTNKPGFYPGGGESTGGDTPVVKLPVKPQAGATRRVSWRELTID